MFKFYKLCYAYVILKLEFPLRLEKPEILKTFIYKKVNFLNKTFHGKLS